MHPTQGKAACLLLLASLCAAPASAADKSVGAKPLPDPTQDELMMSAGFLSSHPDLRFRLNGQKRYEEGEYAEAFSFFQRAAWYGDKPAQGMVAEMLWNGRGVDQDRALAYAWMDLAAERGYELFLAFRERYWAELGEAERVRAVEVGQQVYAEFGDTVAKPRLEAVMRRASRNITGSRTGAVGALKIVIPGPGGGTVIDGTEFYDKQFWEPKRYWQWQAAVMDGVKEGRVIVGDLHRKPDEAGDAAKDKAKPEGDKGD